MRVLVTGSAGFIGGQLIGRLLDRGHSVHGLDERNGASTADMAQLTAVTSRFEPEMIAHLGANCSTARSLRDPGADFQANAVGTFNVCEASRLAGGIPVLFTSTVKVQAGADGLVAPLGLSKQVGEDYLRLYGQLYDVPYVIDRPSTVYGPGQHGSSDLGWVTWFLRAFLNGQRITIHGDGSQSRDILHIDDMTRLLVDQIEHFDAYAGHAYDVGGGPDNEVGLLELLGKLNQEAYGHPEYAHLAFDEALPGDLQRVVTDNGPVTAVRGWQPQVGWVDGVRDTLAWMDRRDRP